MASDLSFVEFVCDQASDAGELIFKKMFGEYAIYLDGKVIALVCDNQLFVKPTTAGSEILTEQIPKALPFPGAKPYFLLTEKIEDRDLIASLFKATARDLPIPKPKKKKTS